MKESGAGASPDEVYHNPVDEMTYVAPGGWKTYLPRTPRPDLPGQTVKTERVRLLTSQADVTARMTVDGLATCCQTLEPQAIGEDERI